jgi:hypothetical protein
MTKTATYRLIEIGLHEEFHGFVAAQRAAGESWDAIARTIYDRTQIAITRETLRNWFAELATQSELSA